MTNEAARAAKQIARQLPERLREHNLTLVSAGVAFYAFLAFVPTLIVIVTVYGLVAKPADIQRQVHDFAKALPDEVQKFIQQQITSIGHASGTRVSIALVIAVAIALWSASGGMAALITGVNVARDQTQPKSFVKKRGKALALTFGAIVLLVVMIFLIAAVPSILAQAGLGTAGRVVFDIVRWPVLAIVMVLGLGVLYHIAVRRPEETRSRVVTPGALVATLLWLIASGLFAVYTANFASYSKTYGSLASIVIVLLWLYLSAVAVLIGAEIDGLSTALPTHADSADATASFPGGQAEMSAARGLGQPCSHHAVDPIPLSPRMLAAHPLPVQPDTELVHVQGSLYSRGFWPPVLCCRAACPCPPCTKARDDRRNALAAR